MSAYALLVSKTMRPTTKDKDKNQSGAEKRDEPTSHTKEGMHGQDTANQDSIHTLGKKKMIMNGSLASFRLVRIVRGCFVNRGLRIRFWELGEVG